MFTFSVSYQHNTSPQGTAFSAFSKSAMISAMFSMPTDT